MPRVTNPGGSLPAGSQAMLVSTTTLTAAQIIGMNVTPVSLVPAPGAGKLIQPFIATCIYTFGTKPFLPSLSPTIWAGPNTVPVSTQLGVYTGPFRGTGISYFYLPAFSDNPVALLPGADNQPLVLTSDTAFNVGPLVTTTLAAGGTGYVVNDTGTIQGSSADATYKVLTVGAGGAVLTYQVTNPGTAYFPANSQPTATGGAQPGVGTGFAVNITAVATGDGTLKVVTYYQIIPVP
jgi:hypothetical protein